jgi:2-polyprenyl-6-methoxyphenol hydroxylase-like FAD-dependent oxidoreductase
MLTPTNPRPHALAAATDVIVVGSRCAGAATAMLLARAGLRVIVLDRAPAHTDTISTHALMRGGVRKLTEWGLLAKATAGAPAVHAVAFHYGDARVRLPFKPRGGIDALYAPRRTVLDPALVSAARRAGAAVHFGVSVRALLHRSDGRVAGVVATDHDGRRVEIAASLVIGADGLRSTVARLTGAHEKAVGGDGSGFAYTYAPVGDRGAFQWYFRPGVSAGVIPTNDGLSCVFVGAHHDRFQHEFAGDPARAYLKLLAEVAPEVADHVAAIPAPAPLRRFPGRPGHIRDAYGPGWALVGDAGYFKDPLTAHGISDALIDAGHVADAAIAAAVDPRLERDAFAVYDAARRERADRMLPVAAALGSYEWDLDDVQQLHLELSAAMNAEEATLAA